MTRSWHSRWPTATTTRAKQRRTRMAMSRTGEDLREIWHRLADLVVHGFPFHPTAESLKRLGDVMEAIEKAQIALDPEVKPYTIPGGQVIGVDKDLDISVLDRLNALPGMKVISTCAGHRDRCPHPSLALVLHMDEPVLIHTRDMLSAALGHTTIISTWYNDSWHAWTIHLEGLYPWRTRRRWWLEITRLLEAAARTAPVVATTSTPTGRAVDTLR